MSINLGIHLRRMAGKDISVQGLNFSHTNVRPKVNVLDSRFTKGARCPK